MPIKYLFKLYVVGGQLGADSVIGGLERFLDKKFPGTSSLKVIDVVKHPELAEEDKVLATPMLIKEKPLPARRIIGDLSDEQKVLSGLNIIPEQSEAGGLE